MSDPQIERWLKRTKLRRVPEEQLRNYTAEVLRKMAQASAPTRTTAPLWPWWRVLVPLGATAILALTFLPRVTPLFSVPSTNADQLVEEAVRLSVSAPEELLFEDEADALFDELAWLDSQLSS